MCYDFQHGIIDDEKDVVFITKLTLFCTCIILLPKGVWVLPKSWVELDVILQLVGFMPNTSVIGIPKLVRIQPRISPKYMLYIPRDLLSLYYWWYTCGWNTCSKADVANENGKMDIYKRGIVHQTKLGHHWTIIMHEALCAIDNNIDRFTKDLVITRSLMNMFMLLSIAHKSCQL
jgi:hypothetical protein